MLSNIDKRIWWLTPNSWIPSGYLRQRINLYLLIVVNFWFNFIYFHTYVLMNKNSSVVVTISCWKLSMIILILYRFVIYWCVLNPDTNSKNTSLENLKPMSKLHTQFQTKSQRFPSAVNTYICESKYFQADWIGFPVKPNKTSRLLHCSLL